MTDDALRATERALVTEPADLELRRRHARLLQRAGQAERALSALDLAWRLGADELWDELKAALDARAVRAGGLELRYIPAGPFVMGEGRLPTEAQRERSQRVRLQPPDGQNLCGFEVNNRPEWVSDRYSPRSYDAARRRDPAGPPRGRSRVVRGVGLPSPAYELYREVATDGVFEGAVRDARQLTGRDDLANPTADVSFRLCVVPGPTS